MTTQKYFTLFVEGAINNSPLLEGEFDKQIEQPRGKTVEVTLVSGIHIVSNFSRVWAKRGKDKAGKPTGELTFLKWGTPGGEQVGIRYLVMSQSLDKQYQDNVEKVTPQDEELEMKLKVGNNDFDMDVEALKIDFLKHHSWNPDNESRNPNINVNMFWELKVDEINKNRFAEKKKRNEAESIVMNAAEDGHITVLAHIFNLDVKKTDEELQSSLLDKVEQDYKIFLHILDETKKNLLGALRSAEEIGVLSGKADGELTVREEANDVPLLPGRRQVGDSPAMFLYENYLSEDVYEAIKRVQLAEVTYKSLVLN